MKYFVGEVRYEKGISLRQLAKQANISKSYLQRIEASEAKPSLEIMVRLAQVLDIHLDCLYQTD